jgi:hypothetical protein
MKSLKSILLLMIAASLTSLLIACGSSSSSGGNNTQPISVSLSNVPTSLSPKATQAVSATVLNDSKSAGVTWSVTCGSTGACGSFSASSSMSGANVTYTAPAAIPTGGTVTLTATSVTDTTKSASTPAISITTNIAVTLSSTPHSIAPGQPTAVTATVINDPAAAGVKWSCVPANACGSFNQNQTASGSPSTFTAPASTGNVRIIATSVTDSTKQASATISVSNAASQTLANGNYVFSASGVDATNSLYSVSGVFTVTGPGVINGGEQDFVDFSNALSDTNLTGSYSFNSDGNLQITLNTGDTLIGPGGQNNTGTGVEVFDVTLVSGSRGLITEFDTWATSSGTLDLQATSSLAAPSGGYAFFTAGLDNSGVPIVIGGVLNVDSPDTISGNNSVFDVNDFEIALVQGAGFAPSSVQGPDPLGRVMFTLNPSAASTVPGIILIGYMVDASQIRLVETNDALVGTTGGTALAQTGAGNFSASSISGSSYVFGTQGADNVGPLQVAGSVTANADGSVSGTLNFNDLATQNGQGGTAISAGTYTVDNTGRVTLTGLTDNTTFGYNLQLYLTGDGHALAISMDSSDALGGFAFQQAASAFNAASFAGNYAMNTNINTSGGQYFAGIGPLYADGAGSLTGFVDLNEQNVPVSALPLSGTFTGNASGIFTGTLTGIYPPNTSTPVNFTYYVIDPAHAVAIETDANQETLGYLELQQ